MWTPASALTPTSAEEMALCLGDAARAGRSIALFGNHSKRLMAGPVMRSDTALSTRRLRRVLRYEPDDLTVSVEAGLPFRELQQLLAERRQMVALDPPFSDEATVGGVVAANMSGPLRHFFGTARDLVIGMTFATLAGKLVSSGGMVVKNVAGLDMGKVLIGSFGTLAAITSVNFRLHLIPDQYRTFLFAAAELDRCLERLRSVLASQLQPLALDVLSPAAAARLNQRGYVLAIRAGGSPAVMHRYERELPGAEVLSERDDAQFWQRLREFTPEFLKRQSAGVVLRVTLPPADLPLLLREVSGPSVSRAGVVVSYVYLSTFENVPFLMRLAQQRDWSCVVEFAPDEARAAGELWPVEKSAERQNGFGMMKGVKRMFDERGLLNASRLYGRI